MKEFDTAIIPENDKLYDPAPEAIGENDNIMRSPAEGLDPKLVVGFEGLAAGGLYNGRQ